MLLACATTAFAAIDEASFAQCAAVGDPGARLACYDALAGRVPGPGMAPAPPAAPAAPAPAVDDFGKPAPSVPKEAVSLKARVVGTLREWQPGTVIKLDNGQTWRVTGEDSGYYPNVPDNPDVVITKTWFGTYRMQILAIDREIKVKRVS